MEGHKEKRLLETGSDRLPGRCWNFSENNNPLEGDFRRPVKLI
jgi:hypothetical protein